MIPFTSPTDYSQRMKREKRKKLEENGEGDLEKISWIEKQRGRVGKR